MCADRCFSTSTKADSASDYTKSIKQKTIFTDIVKQNQNNFIKSNGVNYNENFRLTNQSLTFTKSYDLLLDITKGKYYCDPVNDPNWVSNEVWSSNLYSVNYSANGVNVVVDTSYNAGNSNEIIFPMTQSADIADISWNGVYPGVIVDPSYNIFYNTCNDQNNWRKKLVDMSFNTTNYYKQGKQKSEQLYGMCYPGKLLFNNTVIFAYVANIASNTVSGYTINPTTGALTAIDSFTAGTNPVSITVDPTGKFAYVANSGSNNVSGYTINPTTGALTSISGFTAGTTTISITVDPTGKFAYVANSGSNNVSGYTINSSTGALTSISGSPFTAGSGPYSIITVRI